MAPQVKISFGKNVQIGLDFGSIWPQCGS